MATAANIQEAIDDIVTNLVFPGAISQMSDWMSGMYTPSGFSSFAVGSAKFWDANNADQRTVFDWVIPSLRDQREINSLGNTVGSTNIMINVVLRTLLAVQAANAKNRITQDQEDTVVAIYNSAF